MFVPMSMYRSMHLLSHSSLSMAATVLECALPPSWAELSEAQGRGRVRVEIKEEDKLMIELDTSSLRGSILDVQCMNPAPTITTKMNPLNPAMAIVAQPIEA